MLTTAIPIETKFVTELKESANPNQVLKERKEKNNAFDIYTDGSKISGNKYVGIACTCPELNIDIVRSMDSNASVFTVECAALNYAVDIARKNRQ